MLINLQHRSNELELMDDPEVEDKALETALSDISKVNKLLGGNSITIRAVHKLIEDTDSSQQLTILDLGCGDGEMLRSIAKSLRKKKRNVKLIGIDLSEKCLTYARKLSVSYPEISYQKQNILNLEASKFSYDIILCTLTLHHLKCNEIRDVMKKMIELAKVGVVINDLHRSGIAYYLFKIFSFFFIKGHIAKNDGLISIKRGFKKKELLQYAISMNLQHYNIHWKWAFRYRWVIMTKES
ncbi:methyltransferase domain-containing protein [Aquimarina algiphila]|uniref:methyltransferase domain-containing protein n=1 Tax=Aquimarina algiphila TaxID=2047982 RepID=UPI002493C323|nr:methyltransferase domain-containing protein [Aquimarina algiphila]